MTLGLYWDHSISGISWPVWYQVINSLCICAVPDTKVGFGSSRPKRENVESNGFKLCLESQEMLCY